jgi:hypothetical protein
MRTAIGLFLLAVLAACASVAAPTANPPTAGLTASPVIIYVTPAPTAPGISATPTPEHTTPQPTAPPVANGTRENPYPLGTEATVGDWSVVVHSVDPDAWPQIREENMFNEAPAAGFQFAMFDVSVTFHGPGTGSAWLDLSWAIVGSRGNAFEEGLEYSCGVLPDDLDNVGDLYAGATARGNVCFAVESDQFAGSTIRLQTGFLDDNEAFFATSGGNAQSTPDPATGLSPGYIGMTIEQVGWVDTLLSVDGQAITDALDPLRLRRLRPAVSDALDNAREIQDWLLANPPDNLCYADLHAAWTEFIDDYVDGLETLDYGLTPPVTYDDVADGLEQMTDALELLDNVTAEMDAATCI